MNHLTNQYVMLHDEKTLYHCQACTVACKVLNDVPEGFSRVQVQIRAPEQASNALTHFQFVRVSCQHCENAPCVSVCPTGASYRDENGSCRWINRAVLAAIIVLPHVLSMCAI